MSHHEHDQYFGREDNNLDIYTILDGGRPPILNPKCPGHGESPGKQSNGGNDAEVAIMPARASKRYLEHSEHDIRAKRMTFDRPMSVIGQEGVEEEMVEVGDFGFVPRSVINRAPSPEIACRCTCRCKGCICHFVPYSRQGHYTSMPPIEIDEDSPPLSLMVELDELPASMYSSQRSVSSPEISGLLHGITGVREHYVNGCHGPPELVQRQPVLPNDEDSENNYALELSGSDLDC